MNIWGQAAAVAHVLSAQPPLPTSHVAAFELVPENGLPGRQQNIKLLKYLNSRSLVHVPCNYTLVSYAAQSVLAPTDVSSVWVYVQETVFTH